MTAKRQTPPSPPSPTPGQKRAFVIAVSLIAVAVLALLITSAWHTALYDHRLSQLMRASGTNPWPYQDDGPGHPFEYIQQSNGIVSLYDTTPDDSLIVIPIILLGCLAISILLLGLRLWRPWRLLPLAGATFVCGLILINMHPGQTSRDDLLISRIDPTAKTISGLGHITFNLCGTSLTIQNDDSGHSDTAYDVYFHEPDGTEPELALFPQQQTAIAFTQLVTAKARQAGCPNSITVHDEP